MHEAVAEDDRTQREVLRRSLRERRAALSTPSVRAASDAVCASALTLPPLARARRVALYAATRGEIDPVELRAGLHQRGVEVAYPRVVSSEPPVVEFVAVAPDELLAPGRFGILEPHGGPALDATELDLILVPGIAFSRSGHRLGFGRGYYDRALAAAPRALRVGLCHEFQLVDSWPPRAGDEAVDLVLTPRERVLTRARPLAFEEVPS
ncbi:MAG: 5-formyltetrahydrofolate cyclo-ligase [Myxococcales bacterium]|nr:5-formyltetrahydrofolate cyclo-ligase [Myxococcales bacterium]